MNVSIILISNGEALSQASKFRLCYAVCVLVWALCGFLFGQIRTLQKFGFLANFAIWINLLIMFITMGVAANSPPLYSAYAASAGYSVNPALVKPNAAGQFPPVTHSGGLPDQSNFAASVNGLMNAVYAYSGTQIFLDFMAEMSQPRNFLKAMWSSQGFIYGCYMLYGLFIYGYQGQYVQNPSYLGISPYNWSTVGNSLAMVTAVIAAALYGNIGLKGKSMCETIIQTFFSFLLCHSCLQQYRCTVVQCPTSVHEAWQMDLGRDCADLLVYRVCRRRCHPCLFWIRWLRLRSLRHAIHILIPSTPTCGPHDPEERNGG